MKYLITTAQALGIALVATATLRIPPSGTGTFIGIWLILVGYFFYLLTGGDKK